MTSYIVTLVRVEQLAVHVDAETPLDAKQNWRNGQIVKQMEIEIEVLDARSNV
jgi:hypothetical protein